MSDPSGQAVSMRRRLTYVLATLICAGLLLAGLIWVQRAHGFAVFGGLAEHARERLELAELASLEPIDAHTHISRSGSEFAAMLERLHIHVLDILYVDDTQELRASLDRQREDALQFIVSSNGHATLCTTFDPFRLNDADFPQSAITGLNEDFKQGAVAAKVWKNIGMEIKNAQGRYVLPDDPVFEPIYRDIADQHKTLVIHAAAVDAAWQPQSASLKYFKRDPQWDMWKIPGAPQKKDILRAQDHLLETNPELRVVGAHFAGMTEHLDELAASLDRYPNLAVDTAARVHLLVEQPRDTVLGFLMKYQDRVLYGTDLSFSPGDSEREQVQTWEEQYALDWRYFATNDSFEYYGHRVQGLKLPRVVLRKLYHDNALHWIPGIIGSHDEK